MTRILALATSLFFAVSLSAQTPDSAEKPDYGELSKLVRGMALKSAPKEVTVTPAWGLSTPFPPRLRLPGLARTTIQVGDRLELAHGSWKKAKVWMDNPERDLALAITDIKPLEGSKYRVAVTATAPLLINYEFQQWLNGLMLLGVEGQAKAKVRVDLDCDVALTLDGLKFPPEVTVDPKVSAMKIDVQELEVLNPAAANRPERASAINNELRGFVQNMIQGAEPRIQEEANKAIAAALKDGKGTFSAAKLFEAGKK